MTIIRTEADWWNAFDAFKEHLPNIVHEVYPWDDENRTILNKFDEMVAARNSQQVSYGLNCIWNDAPDAPIIHTWPGWGQLCDLCSEYGVWDDGGIE